MTEGFPGGVPVFVSDGENAAFGKSYFTLPR